VNLLFLAPRVPWPLDTGAKIRTFHLLRGLARVHRVTLLTFYDSELERQAAGALTDLGVEIEIVPRAVDVRARGLDFGLGALGPLPYNIRKYERAAMRARIRQVQLRQRIDVVHCDHLHMSQYGTMFDVPFVIDEHNIESQIVRRYAADHRAGLLKRAGYLEQYVLLRRYEAAQAERAWACLVCSEEDRRELSDISKQRNLRVVPNGVDLEFFGDTNVRLLAEGHLVFTGSMDWQPNEDAARWFHGEVLPEIRYVFPRLPFYVVGRNPSAHLMALGAKDPSTVVTGTVVDVRPYLRGAIALVVPIRVGGGTRLKILEAFAARVPVLSTKVGAEGIAAEPEEHYLRADTPREFAVQVRRLATDQALRQKLTENAAQLVNRRYGWDVISREVASFYEGAPPRTVHP
jgi:sugar transferase (PEP-CTERM/EpsH1 system associated)